MTRLLTDTLRMGSSVFFAMPYTNAEHIARIVDECGLEKLFEIARMWTGPGGVKVEDCEKLYAHWTVEIG